MRASSYGASSSRHSLDGLPQGQRGGPVLPLGQLHGAVGVPGGAAQRERVALGGDALQLVGAGTTRGHVLLGELCLDHRAQQACSVQRLRGVFEGVQQGGTGGVDPAA